MGKFRRFYLEFNGYLFKISLNDGPLGSTEFTTIAVQFSRSLAFKERGDSTNELLSCTQEQFNYTLQDYIM